MTIHQLANIKDLLEVIVNIPVNYLTEIDGVRPSFSSIEKKLERIIKNSKFLLEIAKNHPIEFSAFGLHTLDNIEHSLRILKDSLTSLRVFIETNTEEFRKYHISGFIGKEINKLSNTQTELETSFDRSYRIFDQTIMPIVNEISIKKAERSAQQVSELSNIKEKEAISLYVSHFEKRITHYKGSADSWLYSLFAIIFFAITFIITEFFHFNRGTQRFYDTLSFLEFSSLRLFAFFLFGYAIHFSSKAYKLNRNQQIIYEDKKNALESYDSFEKSNKFKDEVLHHLILAQVTNAIFASHPNGYVDDSKEPSISMLNLGEILKTLPKSGN